MWFLRPTWSPPPKVLWSSVLGSGSFDLAPAHRWGHTGLLEAAAYRVGHAPALT